MSKKSIGIIAISCAIVVMAFTTFYPKYRNRYTNKAQAYLFIDDIDRAIDEYRKHIVSYPNDLGVHLKLIELLLEKGEVESGKRIFSRILKKENIRQKYSDQFSKIISELGYISNEEITQRIEALNEFTPSNPTLFVEYGDSLSKLIIESPFINYIPENGQVTGYIDSVLYFTSVSQYCRSRAYIYIGLRLQGKKTEADQIIYSSDQFIFPPTIEHHYDLTKRKMELVSEVADYIANNNYELKNYSNASLLWEIAKDTRHELINGYDDEVARMHYNYGLALLANGKTILGKMNMVSLMDSMPGYNTEAIKALVGRANEMIILNKLSEFNKYAYDKFKESKWELAIAGYKKLINYAISNNYGKDNEFVAMARYNEAMAYWNLGKYNEAWNLLFRIQQDSPNYEKEIIGEKLNELNSHMGIK